jgi:signal transduction histidine kinase
MTMAARSTPRLRWPQVAVENPTAFFYLFRFITWALAVVVYLTQSAPPVNLRYGAGLALYTLLHLCLGTLYVSVFHPRLARFPGGLTLLRPPRDLLAASVADISASLAVVYFSGGWGSPFWHFAVTSILVPCFLLPFRWATLVITAYVGMYMATVVLGGDGLNGSWQDSQRHIFIGFLVTAYLVGIAVGYLGHLFRALDAERLRTRAALDDQETLFAVTHNVVSASRELEMLLQQVAQTMRERRQYDLFAIYLWHPEENALKLAASTVGVEELEGGPVAASGQGLVGRAASTGVTQVGGDDAMQWRAAVPLRGGDALSKGSRGTLLGVMLAGVRKPIESSARAVSLAEALADQVALGIGQAHLYRRQVELAAQEERGRIAREIHDGIAQSIYALSLSLETCADLAEREKGPLREQLAKLVPLAKSTLLETRHYIYDLKPLLSGEGSLVTMAENQVKEFQMVTGLPVELNVIGEPRRVSVAVATGCYRIVQEGLANILKHARASRIQVELAFRDGQVCLSVQDDGVGFDMGNVRPGYGLENIEQRARELGGSAEISSAVGQGAHISVTLPA